MMRILIVDDDALIRDGLSILLSMENDFTVAGVASNGQEALHFCENNDVDIILMDIRMPIMDGVLCTQKIKAKYPEIKIVILTTFKDDEYIEEALKCGAEGYILKSQSLDSIVNSLRVVKKGYSVFAHDAADTIQHIAKFGKKKKTPESFGITQREYDVLRLLGEGLTNEDIAKSLHISSGTVRNYISSLLQKLNLKDRTQLAVFFHKYL